MLIKNEYFKILNLPLKQHFHFMNSVDGPWRHNRAIFSDRFA